VEERARESVPEFRCAYHVDAGRGGGGGGVVDSCCLFCLRALWHGSERTTCENAKHIVVFCLDSAQQTLYATPSCQCCQLRARDAGNLKKVFLLDVPKYKVF
jgi:hypothetical protein